jgi:uncharacterized membrane protein
MLCYVPLVGWIASIVVLAAPKFHNQRDVRFHAFQGLYLFVAWLMLDWVLIPFIDMTHGLGAMRAVISLLHLAIFIAWIWMLIKTSQQQMYRLPIVGELAERSVAEQGP